MKQCDSFEDKLLSQLLELQHAVIKHSEVQITAANVSWAKGYPSNKEAFWNCEAFMWSRKIDAKKREMIRTELLRHIELESINNLDIGSGSYCYIPSIAFDCSIKMLNFNDSTLQKIEGDLLKKWPLDHNSFTSVTAVFVLNYISDLDFMFSEVKRVLINGGKFVAVISANGVSDLHQQHEKHKFSLIELEQELLRIFDFVEAYEKVGLWFFVCK